MKANSSTCINLEKKTGSKLHSGTFGFTINPIICSVCHKCLCSHVCGLHISMVHSILLHCVRMCSMNGEQRSVQASQTAACSPSHTNRTSYAGDIFLAFYFSRTSLCRRHSSSFLLFPAACVGVTDQL